MKVLLIVFVLVSSCETAEIARVDGPDGEVMYQATCYEGKADCMNTAAKRCKGKYKIIDTEADEEFATVGSGANAQAYGYSVDRVLFKCK